MADRAVFTAIVYVLTAGCSWRHLPPNLGVSPPTAHRRFQQWTRAGLWPRLHRAVLDRHGAAGDIDWSSAIVDAASLRAKRGGSLTGPSPVDRGKKGAKIHVLSHADGLPLVVAISGRTCTTARPWSRWSPASQRSVHDAVPAAGGRSDWRVGS